jgi:hypothetical protein
VSTACSQRLALPPRARKFLLHRDADRRRKLKSATGHNSVPDQSIWFRIKIARIEAQLNTRSSLCDYQTPGATLASFGVKCPSLPVGA